MGGILVAMLGVLAGLVAWLVHDLRRIRAMNFDCPNCRHYGSACDACWETEKRSVEEK